MLADPPWRPQPGTPEEKTGSNFAGNILALLGLFSFFMPFFPVVLSIMGLYLNRSSRRWAWYISWLALVLSVLMSSVFIYEWTHRAPD